MSVAELLRYLKCLRCGTRENLTFYTYSKSYKYKTGGAPIYTVHKGTNSIKTPVCNQCRHKIKMWTRYLYLTVGLLILTEVIFYFVFNSYGTSFFTQNLMGLAIYIGLIFASIIIFLLAQINNPRSFVKFTGHVAYVRPIKSSKWVTFQNWADITIKGNAIQPLEKDPINPLVWKFPLIGGILCLISIITPTQIIFYDDGILRLDWMPLLTFLSEVEIWDYTLGQTFIPVFTFNFFTILMYPVTLLSILTYIIILTAAFVTIKRAYLLKRAGHSVISINNMHLVLGVILIIFISVFFYQNFHEISSATTLICSGIYGVFAGGIFILLGPIIQRLNTREVNNH